MVHEIKTLVLSFHSLIVLEHADEEYMKNILLQVSQATQLPLFSWTITRGFDSNISGPLQISKSEDPLKAISAIKEFPKESLFLLKDFTPHLNSPTSLRLFRETVQKLQNSRSTVFILGPKIDLPHELKHLALAPQIQTASSEEIRQLILSTLRHLHAQSAQKFKIDLELIESPEMAQALSGMTLKQIRQTLAYCVIQDGHLEKSDLKRIQEKKAEFINDSGLLEYTPPANLHFEVGGFKNLKNFLNKAQVGFSSEARKLGLPLPRGILFVGVPGCGKSLCAKYIAQTWNLPLLKFDAGRLFDKYMGETEKNFRRCTESAEKLAPCVLWMDEIEKALGQSSGESSNDSGVGKRVFGQFLTWLQEKTKSVYVVATANNLDQIPPEMLRKGRFDEIFFVDLPTNEERQEILKIHLRRKKQDLHNLDFQLLSLKTDGFSGAELEQVVVSSLLLSLREKRPLSMDLLLEEIAGTRPLSQSRFAEIEALRARGRTQFVSVN